jgi:hypothetical protein
LAAAFAVPAMKITQWIRGLVNVGACGAAFLFGGCQHGLTVKNMNAYRQPGVVSEKPIAVGLSVSSGDEPSGRLGDGIAAGLRNCATEVIYPYSPTGLRKVDVFAKIAIQPKYTGSGANFFINFPGFLIFAPAWNGYVYKVDYDVTVTLENGAGDRAPIDRFSLPIQLNIRHADFNRTWTEISWLEVGVIAFGSGLVFIQYDENVTPLVAEATKSTLGAYIAQEITKKVNASPLMKALPVRVTQIP